MQMQRTESDCLNCCLSELLNIPYEEIPPFWKVWKNGIMEKPTKEECDEYDKQLYSWLNEMGYILISINVKYDPDKDCIELPCMSKKSFRCIGTLRKKERFFSHAVILDVYDGNIYMQDPKENSDYSIEDITYIDFILKDISKENEKCISLNTK